MSSHNHISVEYFLTYEKGGSTFTCPLQFKLFNCMLQDTNPTYQPSFSQSLSTFITVSMTVIWSKMASLLHYHSGTNKIVLSMNGCTHHLCNHCSITEFDHSSEPPPASGIKNSSILQQLHCLQFLLFAISFDVIVIFHSLCHYHHLH